MMALTYKIGSTTFLRSALFLMLIRYVNSELIMKPKDSEAVVGGPTYFNCSSTVTSTEIHWFHYADGNTKDRRFVFGYGQLYSPYDARFQMEKNPTTGVYNLIISSVTIADAGRYECQDEAGSGDKASAQLTVLDGNPECQSNIKPEGLIGPNTCGIDPDELHLTCAVQYHGNQPPIMQWKESGSNSPIEEGVTRNISSNRAIYYLKMQVSSRLDGSSFQCVTTRSTTSEYRCTSETIIIKGTDRASVIIVIITCVVIGLVVAAIAMLLGVKLGKILRGRELKKKNSAQSANIAQRRPTGNEPEYMELIGKEGPKALLHETADTGQLEKLRTEIERLKAKISELEQHRYNADNARYRTTSSPAHMIKTQATEQENAPVIGIAVLENSLYVVSKNSQDVEVYDSKTFVFDRLIKNQPFKNPLDIAASKTDKRLYVFNKLDESSNTIVKVIITGVDLRGKCWVTEDDDGRLSTFESNLIASFLTKRIVVEYSPEGETVNTVRLSPGNGFNTIWHALKLTGTHFAISHSKVEGDGQRVSVVDITGNVLSTFEDVPLNIATLDILNRVHLPLCLAEDGEKSLFVADARNRRVLLLGSKLKYEGELIETGRNQIPVRLCLNETRDRVFVGVNSGEYSNPESWTNGRILIYNITK